MSKPNVAFLGTGLMGSHMARNILKAGFPLKAWNRTRAKAEALTKDGATVCDTAVQAVKDADFVITMLSDGPTVKTLMIDDNLIGQMKKNAVFIDMSSIRPNEAREHAEVLVKSDLRILDAPVSGGTKGAENAELAIMAGGDEATFKDAFSVLEAMGRPVRVGNAGTGQLSKLANQAIVAVTIGVVAEAMFLAEKGGADPAAIRQALKGGFADSIPLQQHGERMTTGNFVPGGPSKFQLKDLNSVLEEAKTYGLKLPLTEQITERFKHFCDNMDGGDKDHSGIYLELLEQNS
ncbi:MAG: NAD(P)-dependent oxidoreductase [Rhizobiales bacterium]|nr:NAD(P)-dependent oxidoreductase [Hyphomicrobiales bacterium]